MSERPESYWTPLLLPLRPCDLGDMTPAQLLAAYDYCEQRIKNGIW